MGSARNGCSPERVEPLGMVRKTYGDAAGHDVFSVEGSEDEHPELTLRPKPAEVSSDFNIRIFT